MRKITALAILTGAILALSPGALAQEGAGKKPEEGQGRPRPPPPNLASLMIGQVEMGKESTVRIHYEFEDEAELMDWESWGEEPKVSSGRLALAEESGLIHQLPFARAMRVDVTARRMRSLSIELAGNGETEGTGYRVAVTSGRPGRLEVIRAGETWAEEEIDVSRPKTASVAYEKGALVVTVDGSEVFRRADAEPPAGSRILIGGGERSVLVESLSIQAGYDAAEVRAAGLKRPLPPGRWIPFIGDAGKGDFSTGRGWTVENRTLRYNGGPGGEGWSAYRGIDTADLGSYVLELEVKTDSPRWRRGRESGYVYVSFAKGGLRSSWGFSGEGSRVGELEWTGRPRTLSRGKWHSLRIVVKGNRAEGLLDGVQSWSVTGTDGFREYDRPDRRWFGFGGSNGPLHFRNIRLMVSETGR